MNLGRFYRTALAMAVFGMASLLSAQNEAPQATSTASHAKKRHKRRRRKVVAAAQPPVVTSTSGRAVERTTTQAGLLHSDTATSLRTASVRRYRHRHIYVNPWTEPTYADSTVGDSVDGEDLVVRKAAIDALGPYNGAVVVADSATGRILSIVNQKLALKGAFEPCSTVKMVVSFASLSEGILGTNTAVYLTRRYRMDMTQAIAHSNNLYFAKLGQELGFDRVEKYAKLFGLGEKAGLDIPGEEAGYLTDAPPSTGVGMMTSFGDGIRVTPLELTSIVSTIANGGTMYYLQYPRSDEDIAKFVPRIKRTLDIAEYIPQVKEGMRGAVEFPYGTAHRANFDPNEPIFGKTGTCTDVAQPGVHLGWFASFDDVANRKLAVVVLLTGGRGISGPIAAGIAGNVYHNLAQQHYLESDQPSVTTSSITSSLAPVQNRP